MVIWLDKIQHNRHIMYLLLVDFPDKYLPVTNERQQLIKQQSPIIHNTLNSTLTFEKYPIKCVPELSECVST